MNKKKSNKKISIPIVNNEGEKIDSLEISNKEQWAGKPHYEILYKSGQGKDSKFWLLYRFSMEDYTDQDYAIKISASEAITWLRRNGIEFSEGSKTRSELSNKSKCLNKFNDICSEEQFERVATAEQIANYYSLDEQYTSQRLIDEFKKRRRTSKKKSKSSSESMDNVAIVTPNIKLVDPLGGGQIVKNYWRFKNIQYLFE